LWHFRLLLEIDDPLKRAFYEIESIKGNWAVRELKRQIGSLYIEAQRRLLEAGGNKCGL
jgi:predicted nuclease of restriction endonuclease-like (RecB) superfamily